MKYELISNFHGNEMEALLQAVRPTSSIDLSGRGEVLTNKEAEQESKGIDWAEFDKQDQIIMSSNE